MSATMSPRRSKGPATARFFEANLRHIKGPMIGKPMRLDPWQLEDIDLILEVDERGMPVWREVLWGVARGMGKSPTAAGLGLTCLAERDDRPEIYIGSGSRDQAKIVGEFAREMARTGPLSDWTRPVIGGVAWDRPGGGVMTVVSAEGGLQHGKSPAKSILDELHVFTTHGREELYNTQVSSLHKRADSQLLGITTAGFSRLTLLGELYDTMLEAPVVERTGPLGCRLVCEDRENGRLMIWWGAHDDLDLEDPAVWAACNPASWIEAEQIARLARTLPRGVFERLHLNRWTESSAVVIRPEAVSACRMDWLPPIDSNAPAWLGISASPRRTSGAVVGVWRAGERLVAELVGHWEDVDQGELETNVIAASEEWARGNPCAGIAADRIQLTRAYERLSASLGEWRGDRAKLGGMPQTDAFLEPATATLASAIESTRFGFDGDETLRRQILAAEAANTRRGWRLERPRAVGTRKAQSVEAAIALSMAAYAVETTPAFAMFGA
jgi:hypothetical protein